MKMLDFALGLIETRGLVGAIEAADAATKAAKVKLIAKEKVQGGLVTIKFIGDVAAVRASVDAGSAAAARVGELISSHVIPRPVGDLETLIFAEQVPQIDTPPKPDVKPVKRGRKPKAPAPKSSAIIALKEEKPVIQEPTPIPTSDDEKEYLQQLQALTVHELRRYARSVEGLTIFGRQISMANKEKLIVELMNAKFPK
ncbi:MAG: BMC domain-containing protein [Bacteroidota bacterium]|nr:BMC domain-containing protein [Bacteroidota bacterium]